jgi:hypothetical protein
VHPASNEGNGVAPLGSGACRGRPRVPNYYCPSNLHSATTRKRSEVCARTTQRAEGSPRAELAQWSTSAQSQVASSS